MKKFLRNNSLSLVMFGLFGISIVGQFLTGQAAYNQELAEHGRSILGLAQYAVSGAFVESVFENWESEFLQMGIFVILTVFLRQNGSSESKAPSRMDEAKLSIDKPTARGRSPWPVRRGGLVLKLYRHSLSIALFTLFAISFILHAAGGARKESDENAIHANPERVTTLQYMTTSKFWFESFQNWQSEFLSVGALVVLSIFLREEGSPQSKALKTPNDKNEEEAA